MGKFSRQRQFSAQRMDAVQIISDRRRRAALQRILQLGRLNEGIAVAIAADPAAHAQETLRPRPQHPFPPGIERGQHGQEAVPKISEDIFDFVGNEQLFAAQRACLPQERDLAKDSFVQIFPVRRFRAPRVFEVHQVGDAVLVVDHALAPHLGRVGGQHRHDQAVCQKVEHRVAPHALRFKTLERGGDIGARFGRDTLAILRQIGEHRKQHEAAREIQRIIEAERIQPGVGKVRAVKPSRAIDRGGADIFGLLIEFFPAIGANDVTQQPPEIADIGILRDRRGGLLCVALHGRYAALRHGSRQGGWRLSPPAPVNRPDASRKR